MGNEVENNTDFTLPANRSKKKLPKWLKRILITISTLFILFCLTILLLLTVFEDEIVNYALTYFSKNIKTKTSIESAELTLWTNFPSASIQFNNIYIEENSNQHDTLIKAEKMFVSFDVIDLFSGNYQFDEIGIEQGFCNLKVNKQGEENWNVWITDSTQNASSEKYEIAIENILTEEIQFIYKNDSSNQHIHLNINDIEASGAFTSSVFDIEIEGSLRSKTLSLNNKSFLKNKDFIFNSIIHLDTEKSRIELNKTNVSIENIPLLFEGALEFGLHPNVTCNVEKTELTFKDIVSLLPEEINAQFSPYDPEGTAIFDLSIHGPLDKINVLTHIDITDGSLKEINTGVQLKNIQFSGIYTLNNGTDSIQIKTLQAQLGMGNININGSIYPKQNPEVHLSLQANSDLNDLKNFLAWDSLTTCSGGLNLNARVDGKIEFSSVDSSFVWSGVEMAGEAQITNAEFQWYGTSQHLKNINGTLSLLEQKAKVESFNFNLNNTQISIAGELQNLIPYLTNSNEDLLVNTRVYIPEFKLENWINSQEDASGIGMPNNIRLVLQTNVDAFSYQTFNAKKVQGIIEAYQGTFSLSPLRMDIANGEMQTDVLLSPKENGYTEIEATARLEDIAIDDVFRLFNNFDQTSLTDSNIKGKTHATIEFQGMFDASFNPIPSSIVSDIDVQIENGELINVQSLQYITDYIRSNKWIAPFVNENEFSEKLKHVQFETLENTIHIENERIDIPLMNIESNALDITLEGSHTFANYLDYKFGFNLKDVLLSNDGTSGRQIYIFMKGPWENLEFGLDKDALRADRIEQRNEKKAKLKEKFRNRLNLPSIPKREGKLSVIDEGERNKIQSRAGEKIEKIQTNVIPLLKNESKMTDEEKKRVEQAGKGKQLPKWLQEKGQYEEEEE
jgi:hypothetical protein